MICPIYQLATLNSKSSRNDARQMFGNFYGSSIKFGHEIALICFTIITNWKPSCVTSYTEHPLKLYWQLSVSLPHKKKEKKKKLPTTKICQVFNRTATATPVQGLQSNWLGVCSCGGSSSTTPNGDTLQPPRALSRPHKFHFMPI